MAYFSSRIWLGKKIRGEEYARRFNVSRHDAEKYFHTAHSIADYASSWQEFRGEEFTRVLTDKQKAKYHRDVQRKKAKKRQSA